MSQHRFTTPLVAISFLCCAWLIGCGGQAAKVDDAPFREAIGRYLERNNMALAIKEIKEGPLVVDDKSARLQASLTHQELGGPSVTWEFEFAKQPDGSWDVSSHQD